jgi:hypothetical protein
MERTKSTLKYKIPALIFNPLLTGLCIYAICLGVAEKLWLLAVGYFALFVMGLSLTILALWEIQWIVFEENQITAKNIFGVIKSIPYEKINKVATVNQHFARLKSVPLFNRECLVVCTTKSFPKSKVTGAFNAKKAGYIIFENTFENNSALRLAYKKATGRDLEIK